MNTLDAPVPAKFGAALIPKQDSEWTIPAVSQYSRQASIEHQKYIYNVGPKSHLKHTPLGPYFIPECPEGAAYSQPCIIPGVLFETVPTSPTERKMEIREVDGAAFARDLLGIGPHQNFRDSLARHGVFIAAGRVPTDDELQNARKELDSLYSDWISDADQKYSLNNGIVVIDGTPKSSISERHLEAAKGLGIQRPWRSGNRRQVECDQCGEANMATASRCKSCKKVFNEEQDRKNFPYDYLVDDQPERRGPGRPRTQVA